MTSLTATDRAWVVSHTSSISCSVSEILHVNPQTYFGQFRGTSAHTVAAGSPASEGIWILYYKPVARHILQMQTLYSFTHLQSPHVLPLSYFSFQLSRHNLSFGSRAFRVSAPKVWNTLPLHTRQSQSLFTFRRHLKTHYFQLAYPAILASIHQCP